MTISPYPVDYLLTYGHEDEDVSFFIETYLKEQARFIDHVRGRDAELTIPARDAVGILNDLLYKVEKQKDRTLPIPIQLIPGFCWVGGFHNAIMDWAHPDYKWVRKYYDHLLSYEALSTEQNIKKSRAATGGWQLRGRGKEIDNLVTFLVYLRLVMVVLAENPIGE